MFASHFVFVQLVIPAEVESMQTVMRILFAAEF